MNLSARYVSRRLFYGLILIIAFWLKIKFIKFFAWESRWIDSVSDARATEMKWMIKARLNSVLFQLLWSCAPVLVSISSFLAFVLQGNELTIGIAFTVRLSSFVPVSKSD
jgi:hypothetical protein